MTRRGRLIAAITAHEAALGLGEDERRRRRRALVGASAIEEVATPLLFGLLIDLQARLARGRPAPRRRPQPVRGGFDV